MIGFVWRHDKARRVNHMASRHQERFELPSRGEDHPRSPSKFRTMAIIVLAFLGGILIGLNEQDFKGYVLSLRSDLRSKQEYYDNDSDDYRDSILWTKPACTLPQLNTTEKFPLNCAPRVIIGGAMKCGTNEAGSLLALHPRVAFKLVNKSSGVPFDHNEVQGSLQSDGSASLWESSPWFLTRPNRYKDYFQRFPQTDGVNNITIDKSPAFMKIDGLPEIVHRFMPNTRIVFTLCDPAERLVSEYYHHHRSEENLQFFDGKFHDQGLEPPTTVDEFASIIDGSHPQCKDVLKKSCEAIRDYFLINGWYVEHLKRWWHYLDREDTLVINMNASPVSNAKKLLKFAGLPLSEYPWEKVPEGKSYSNHGVEGYTGREGAWKDHPDAMQIFADFYSQSNQELAMSIGEDFPLHWKSTSLAVPKLMDNRTRFLV